MDFITDLSDSNGIVFLLFLIYSKVPYASDTASISMKFSLIVAPICLKLLDIYLLFS
jgi:hypothetical protein